MANNCEHLFEKESLTKEEAATLVSSCHEDGLLCLDRLTELLPDVAQQLAGFDGTLELTGLKNLAADAAAALRTHEWNLVVTDIDSLTHDAAEALAEHKGRIELGLIELTNVKLARKLATDEEGELELWLSESCPEVAEALACTRGDLLLDDLYDLSAEVALALSKHCITLSLIGVSNLSGGAAAAIAHHRGELRLGLTGLTADVARGLAACDEDSCLRLDWLSALSADEAMCLATTKARLSFEGLSSLPFEVARSLAAHRAQLSLCGLRRMPPRVAECLAQHKGGCLVLDGVQSLAPPAAAALAAYSGRLSLRGTRC